jgi:hypothetical protein
MKYHRLNKNYTLKTRDSATSPFSITWPLHCYQVHEWTIEKPGNQSQISLQTCRVVTEKKQNINIISILSIAILK